MNPEANFRGLLLEKGPPGPPHGPNWPFFYIGLKTMDKLKFTAWFDVNRTFGSGEIRFLNPGGPFGPPRPLRVKTHLFFFDFWVRGPFSEAIWQVSEDPNHTEFVSVQCSHLVHFFPDFGLDPDFFQEIGSEMVCVSHFEHATTIQWMFCQAQNIKKSGH